MMLRRFRRDRWFYAVIVVLLAVGIGSSALVFGFVNELLLKPLPVRDAKNLYLVQHIATKQVRPDTASSERAFQEVVRRSPLVAAAVAETVMEPQYIVPMKANGTTRLLMAQV